MYVHTYSTSPACVVSPPSAFGDEKGEGATRKTSKKATWRFSKHLPAAPYYWLRRARRDLGPCRVTHEARDPPEISAQTARLGVSTPLERCKVGGAARGSIGPWISLFAPTTAIVSPQPTAKNTTPRAGGGGSPSWLENRRIRRAAETPSLLTSSSGSPTGRCRPTRTLLHDRRGPEAVRAGRREAEAHSGRAGRWRRPVAVAPDGAPDGDGAVVRQPEHVSTSRSMCWCRTSSP